MLSAIDWWSLAWAPEQLPDALRTLAHAARLPGLRAVPIGALAPPVEASVESHAAAQGLEALPIELTHAELHGELTRMGPALVRLSDSAERSAYLLVLRSTRKRVRLLAPRGPIQVPLRALASRISESLTERPRRLVAGWLAHAEISPARRTRAQERWLNMLLLNRPIHGVWLLRADPGSSFVAALSGGGVLRTGVQLVAAAIGGVVIQLLALSVVGAEVLRGEFAPGWSMAFCLLLISGLPLQLLSTWLGGQFGLQLAVRLKQRMLCGALRIDPAVVRARGSGGLLAMVSESEAIERAGLDGSVLVIVALVQLVAAGVALQLGASSLLHVLLLSGLVLGLVGLAVQLTRRLSLWTEQRFALSERFVENLQGYRTRVVQGSPDTWHLSEDEQLAAYAHSHGQLDRASRLLTVCATRGWLTLGLLGLIPGLLSGAEPARIGLSLLGIMQAHQAFQILGRNLGGLLSAAAAWRSVGPLFRAAKSSDPQGVIAALPQAPRDDSKAVLLELRGVSLRHARANRDVLRACDLVVRRGDRILVEGASGSGKSSLANTLAGVYRPTSGLMLLHGLDLPALGSTLWRSQIASAPQFHENHLLSASLAFNLLMGRCWPAEPDDLVEAQRVCERLGLGPLIAKMPAGLHQSVGETGWQLSHGERSRVFLARALLQRASLVVLDESFGALDPETQRACVDAARDLAQTIIVIAHP